MNQRRSGVLVPLFSVTSTHSWGVGEYRDLALFAPWVRAAGQGFVQILPITEVPDDDTSPYSALTAMALDAIHIALPGLEDFEALGGEAALPAEDREALAALRAAPRVRHREVRALKGRWLRQAYERFVATDLRRHTPRAERYQAFVRDHATWLEDYALFRALREHHARKPWWEWPEADARRNDAAMRHARETLQDEITFRKYVQWVATEQWDDARRRCGRVEVFGDVPFMISADSPDVWTRQDEFRFDGTVGVPPDAFSETGQDWGLPPLRWDRMAENDFEWIRRRAARMAQVFHGFRLDHLVGLYRTYIRPLDKDVEPFFVPPDVPGQTALGETLVSIYLATGAEIIAEDLGTVPDFVRASLRRLGVPGYKVLRWERHWKKKPKQPFIDPAEYDATSVATTGTHDTETLATWWEELPAADRDMVLKMPSVAKYLDESDSPLDAMVQALLDARSRLTILPLQDVFGWTDRVNIPAQVTDDNWTWIMPWRVDRLLDIPEARERADALGAWTRAANRAVEG